MSNNYIKKEIKRGVMKDRKKRHLKKTDEVTSYKDEEEMEQDSYINPVEAGNNDIYDQHERITNTNDLPTRFTQNDIMQRELLENIRQ